MTTLLERMKEIADKAEELQSLAEDLHKEVDEAINNPEWLLPHNLEENNESENNSTKNTKGRQGEEPEATVL